MGITCAVSVRKLGSDRISCSLYSDSIDQALKELMTMAHDLVSLENLHHLAIEAGFEHDFLSHFGSKVLPSKKDAELEFWIGLIHRKLSVALERESVIKGRHNISDKVSPSFLTEFNLIVSYRSKLVFVVLLSFAGSRKYSVYSCPFCLSRKTIEVILVKAKYKGS